MDRWKSFICRIFIKADQSDVFHYWVEPKKMAQWLFRTCEIRENSSYSESSILKKGQKLDWLWWNNGSSQIEVLKIEDKESLRFTIWPNQTVEVQFSTVAGATLVELLQEDQNTDPQKQLQNYLNYKLTWSFYLNNLKSVLEHGFDLRETNLEQIKEVVVNA